MVVCSVLYFPFTQKKQIRQFRGTQITPHLVLNIESSTAQRIIEIRENIKKKKKITSYLFNGALKIVLKLIWAPNPSTNTSPTFTLRILEQRRLQITFLDGIIAPSNKAFTSCPLKKKKQKETYMNNFLYKHLEYEFLN